MSYSLNQFSLTEDSPFVFISLKASERLTPSKWISKSMARQISAPFYWHTYFPIIGKSRGNNIIQRNYHLSKRQIESVCFWIAPLHKCSDLNTINVLVWASYQKILGQLVELHKLHVQLPHPQLPCQNLLHVIKTP